MQARWYQIAEVWLVLAILLASFLASAWLINAAVSHPDPSVLEHPASALPPAHASKPES